jgi:hypothetical protein
VKRAVPAVLRVTKTLSPVLTPLRDGLDDLTPIVDSLAVHGCDVANFADNWRSVLGYGAPSKRALPGGDAGNFNQLRVQLLGGPQTVGSVLPGVGNGFSHRRDILGPPCQSSPGREYPQLSEIPIGRTAR